MELPGQMGRGIKGNPVLHTLHTGTACKVNIHRIDNKLARLINRC